MKIPPQAIEIEQAVLGACLIEQTVIQDIENILNDECFYKKQHQMLWRTIEELNQENKPVDLLSVSEKLKRENILEEIGAYYLTQLTKGIVTISVEYYARIIYQKYIQREIIKQAYGLIENAYVDFDETMTNYQIFTDSIDRLYSGKQNIQTLKEIARQHKETLDKRIERAEENGIQGVDTGLFDLNQITNGWQANDLIIVAARPGMGKTALALKEAKAAAKKNNVLMFSLEMENISLFDRLVCGNKGIDSNRMKAGRLTNKEHDLYHKSIQELISLKIMIDDTASAGMKHIRATARQKHRKGECDMIIVDYLQLIEAQRDKNKNREQEVANITRELKILAKELNIPILLLCQLSRAVEIRGGNKKPLLSDLRESGAIEQDADKVLFIYRPMYYGIRQDDNGQSTEGIMLLNLAKHRNGRIKEITVKHSYDLTEIYDYDEKYEKSR